MDLRINDIYYYALQTDARVVVLYGGADSGKSYFVGDQYIPLQMLGEDHFKCVAVRKTESTVYDSCFTEVENGLERIGADKFFTFTRSRGNYRIKSNINKNEIIFRGLDKISKLKSITGINCIWVEEAEEIEQTEFLNLLLRLRGGGHERIILTYNPVDDSHFSKAMFIDTEKTILERHPWSTAKHPDGEPKVWTIKIQDDIEDLDGNVEHVEYTVLVINTTYKDNAFIQAQRKLALEQLKHDNPHLYKVLARGQYAPTGKKIIQNWVIRDLSDVKSQFDNVKYGLDWGFYPDPFRFHAVHVDIKQKQLFIFDELNLYENTNDMIAPKIKEILHKPNARIVADSAQPKDIADLKNNYGLHLYPAIKGPGSVDTGLKKLREFTIYVDPKCTGAIEDFRLYSNKVDRSGKVLNDPVDAFNHTPDVLRYILEPYSTGTKRVKIL